MKFVLKVLSATKMYYPLALYNNRLVHSVLCLLIFDRKLSLKCDEFEKRDFNLTIRT